MTPSEFVELYYQSANFRNKYLLHSIAKGNIGLAFNPSINYPKYRPVKFRSGSKSAYLAGTVYIDPNEKLGNGFHNLEDVKAHELGHHVDNILKRKYTDYSETYPIFQQNKLFQKIILDNGEAESCFLEKPNNIVTIEHDAAPSESYADLMALRYLLYNSGIYDSITETKSFTKDHLNKFKKINPNYRLFNYFTDDQVVQMMNEVAQNDTSQYDQNLYAKKGTKLIPRKFKRFKK